MAGGVDGAMAGKGRRSRRNRSPAARSIEVGVRCANGDGLQLRLSCTGKSAAAKKVVDTLPDGDGCIPPGAAARWVQEFAEAMGFLEDPEILGTGKARILSMMMEIMRLGVDCLGEIRLEESRAKPKAKLAIVGGRDLART